MYYDLYSDAPDILMEFLEYHSTVRGHSDRTAAAYYTDLKILFRFVKLRHGIVNRNVPFNDIPIDDVDIEFIKSIKIEDLIRYQSFSTEPNQSLSASSRCRRTSSVKSFYTYLYSKRHLIDNILTDELDMPKKPSTLPRYLEESECEKLLNACSGRNMYRDYAILMVLMSCGLRVSELVGLNLSDVYEDHVRVTGKGNKERIVYFGAGCREAIDDYLFIRDSGHIKPGNENALFLSRNNQRITARAVENLVDKRILEAGLDPSRYSPHKLRHTAATLMLKNGVDTRALQEVLGHSNLSTTQIYTHIDNTSLREAALANPIGRTTKSEKENSD